MKILGVLITLALMQMSCLADGFYFCFKPACTKTYLKFNQSQMVSHLVKNHKCKKLSVNKVKMPNNEIVEIIPDTLSQTIFIQNGWFNYAKNNEDMKLFINAWKLDEKEIARLKPSKPINNFPERSSSQWDSLVQERRNELNNREGTLRDLTTGNNNTRLPNGSYGAGMRGFRRF
jgi:hypothetical protein